MIDADLSPGPAPAVAPPTATVPAPPAEAPKLADWLVPMDRIAEDDGYLERLGDRHWAFFAEDSPTLLVTFESAAHLRDRKDNLPEGLALAKARGWSHLCLIAEGPTWYRDRAVYGYFDRLVDDAFFEDFDRVIFLGAGMGGYAAAAYSVTAPGAQVVAISPRATLDPALAGWDDRDRKARRLNFSDRYGFAPAMVDGAEHVWLIHDPVHAPDAMHAALFHRPHVTPLPARHTGERLAAMLDAAGVIGPVLDAVSVGAMTPGVFAKVWRARRDHGGYLRNLVQVLQDSGRTGLEIRALRSITRRMNAPRLARRLAALTGTPAKD